MWRYDFFHKISKIFGQTDMVAWGLYRPPSMIRWGTGRPVRGFDSLGTVPTTEHDTLGD